ncbi:hypothetical protein NA57DRAFT_72353 [Rhizodiscina lignyota]|uniref:Uncharacterized protein n=1 Tax=Rhizodiscina lignyota TaxID=1504668 RepID=A0A9P4M9Z9_9PEZI|nr:hypothetical protein NA57DRAFT_72353 [Rhizodiscina lignyota]
MDGPHAVERSEKQNVQQGDAMQRTSSSSKRSAPHYAQRRRESARSTGNGMKIVDLGKDTSDNSPVGTGTRSSGEEPPEHYRHKYLYFRGSSREDITALPGSRELNVSPHLRPATQDNADIPYNFHLHSLSHTSMASQRYTPGKLQHQSSKRAAQDVGLPKRKSTKRRKDDHIREEEIRAMSAPVNVGKRPATYNSGILRRESKRVRNGMNRRFERPESDISLPMEDSIHSSMSGNSDPYSYHLSRLDVFAPRPLIRSSFNSHSQGGLNPQALVSQTDSRRVDSRSQNRRPPPTKDILKGKKTVDELADDLDSSDIRAALERDRRRKDAKIAKETERLKRKLARKAEKQRLKEAGMEVEASPSKRKRKDLDKHLGLGIESPNLTEVESPKQKKKKDVIGPTSLAGLESPKFKKKDLEKHLGDKISNTRQLPKLQTSTGNQEAVRKESYLDYSKALQLNTDLDEPGSSLAEQLRLGGPLSEEALLNIHPAHRPQGSALSLGREAELITATSSTPRLTRVPTSPQQPKSTDSPESVEALPPLPSSPSKGEAQTSRSSSRRSSRGFISFFKRGPSLRNREPERGRTITTPSDVSLSNPSRESMHRYHLPSNILTSTVSETSPPRQPLSHSTSQAQRPSTVGRTGSASTTATTSRHRDRSGTPVRTMSKFREDLPELPLSPPDSRMTSPAPDLPPSALAVRRGLSSAGIGKLNFDPGLPFLSDSRSGSNAPSLENEDKALKSVGLMSTSLASVDSEGSWLSGKPSKKVSVRRSARNSVVSNSGLQKFSQNPSYEELGMDEDEYFRRLTPGPEERNASGQSEGMGRKPSSSLMAKSTPRIGYDGEDEGEATENEEDLRRSSIQKVEESDLKTGDVGKTPRFVQREHHAKSREGLLTEYEALGLTPEKAIAIVNGLESPPSEADLRHLHLHATEEVETPDPISPATDNDTDTFDIATPSPTEAVTVARASSVKMKKEQMSPKLLDIPARRASGSTAGSDVPTPRKLSRDVTPVGRMSFDENVEPSNTGTYL